MNSRTSSNILGTVALCQINSVVGSDSIVDVVVAECEKAVSAGKSLSVFPELTISGYPAEDLWLSSEFADRCIARQVLLEEKLSASKFAGLTVIFGNVARLEGAKPPKVHSGSPADLLSSETNALVNAAFALACGVEGGKSQIVAVKKDLPNYGVFDERRWFSPCPKGWAPPVSGELAKFAVAICEDIWNPPHEVVGVTDQTELIVILNASPYRRGKQQLRLEVTQNLAAHYRLPVAYCNYLGGLDELVFDGGSFLMSENGEVVEKGVRLKTDREVIVEGLRSYCQKNGFSSAVLGLSGGIDSAVVATLAVEALGRNNVVGVLMPSLYSSDHSITDAKALAENLGIRSFTFPIADCFKQFKSSFAASFGEPSVDITNQNLQARIRGQILMAYSNQRGAAGENCLVLATGNKSELAVGYSTIYGDAVGGFAPIKDLLKTEVYSLAKELNAGFSSRGLVAPIPENTLLKPPSAELAPGQVDQDSLPPYPELDAILRALIEGHLSDPVSETSSSETIARVKKMLKNSEWKRKQYPLGPKLTAVSFGKDWRLPLSATWF